MNASDDNRSSAEVEGEAEGVRAELAHTLSQLRDNLKPANVVEEVVGNARIGAATLADYLYGLARENPIPAVLIGLGSTMILGLGARSLPSTRPTTPKIVEFDGATSSSSTALPRAAALAPIRRGSADPSVLTTPRPAYERVRETMNTSNRSSRREPPLSEPSRLSGLLDEQPLILAAIGVAVGAAVGAVLPSTRVENEWVGESSSSFRKAATDAARDEVNVISDVVGRTAQNVRQTAVDRGLSTENVTGLVRDVGEHAKAAMHDVRPTATDELKPT